MKETWPVVEAFSKEMESKLQDNIHKGGREGWEDDYPEDLLSRLKEEVSELEEALRLRNSLPLGASSPAMTSRITKEAADVANFAMMIADVCGGLNVKRTK